MPRRKQEPLKVESKRAREDDIENEDIQNKNGNDENETQVHVKSNKIVSLTINQGCESGKFLWKQKLEVAKGYRFCFHFGHSYQTSKT